jgi:hypothetical protein
MHDPQTVAFDFRWPFTRAPLLTIWHVDPEREDACEHGLRSDDSCGWFNPPTPADIRAKVLDLGRREFETLFRRRWALSHKRDYAHVCYEPTCYQAVFWAWIEIDHLMSGKRRDPDRAARAYIFRLANSPVDNLRVPFASATSPASCAEFFMLVFLAYSRFKRPVWKHPRWHIWHWRLQIHPWQALRRRLFDRCEHCGEPFRRESPVTSRWELEPPGWFQSTRGLFHRNCFDERGRAEQAQRAKRIADLNSSQVGGT